MKTQVIAAFLGVVLAAATWTMSFAQTSPSTSGSAPAASTTPVAIQLSVGDLKKKLEAKEPLFLLDVRSAEEFTVDGHVAGATLIPLPDLVSRKGELPADKPIAIICRSGRRSLSAYATLEQLGFKSLMNVDGGMKAWAAAGYPIEKP